MVLASSWVSGLVLAYGIGAGSGPPERSDVAAADGSGVGEVMGRREEKGCTGISGGFLGSDRVYCLILGVIPDDNWGIPLLTDMLLWDVSFGV